MHAHVCRDVTCVYAMRSHILVDDLLLACAVRSRAGRGLIVIIMWQQE